MSFVCDVCDFHIIVYHVSRPVHLHSCSPFLGLYIIYVCVCFDSLIRSQPVLLGLIDQPEVIDQSGGCQASKSLGIGAAKDSKSGGRAHYCLLFTLNVDV